jgi:hypothetical protein
VRHLELLQWQSLLGKLALVAEDSRKPGKSWRLSLGEEDGAEQQARADLVGPLAATRKR